GPPDVLDSIEPVTDILASVVPLPGRAAGVLLTDRKRERAAFEQSRTMSALVDTILENLPAMVFMKDANDLRFERFNRAGEELLGLSREKLVGKNDFDFFPREQAEFFQSKDRAVLADGRVIDIEEEPIDTAHGRRWLHTRKVPIVDALGAPRHLLGISMDI